MSSKNSEAEWRDGSLRQITTTASKKSQITAVCTEKKAIYVFYQNTDNLLAELVYVSSSRWSSVMQFTNTISADWPLGLLIVGHKLSYNNS